MFNLGAPFSVSSMVLPVVVLLTITVQGLVWHSVKPGVYLQVLPT
jgi:hypothetical protein